MSWNTVAMHGLPPDATPVMLRRAPRSDVEVYNGVFGSLSPDVRWLPLVEADEIPEWSDVAPVPMTDAEKRALRLRNAGRVVSGLPPLKFTAYDDDRKFYKAIADEALRMCADIIDENWSGSAAATLLRSLADEEREP